MARDAAQWARNMMIASNGSNKEKFDLGKRISTSYGINWVVNKAGEVTQVFLRDYDPVTTTAGFSLTKDDIVQAGSGITYRSSSQEYLLDRRWENRYYADNSQKTVTINGEKVTIMSTFTIESVWVPNKQARISVSDTEFNGPHDSGLFSDFLDKVGNIGQVDGIIPSTDSDDTAGLPDIFKNPKTLKNVELTDTSMPVLKDGMPGTKSIMDIIVNAIKIRIWAEKTGGKVPDLDFGKSKEDTIWLRQGNFRFDENDTLYHIDGTKYLQKEGGGKGVFPIN